MKLLHTCQNVINCMSTALEMTKTNLGHISLSLSLAQHLSQIPDSANNLASNLLSYNRRFGSAISVAY